MHITGNVTIGEGASRDRARVLEKESIGARLIISVGSVIINIIPDEGMVVDVPGRVFKT